MRKIYIYLLLSAVTALAQMSYHHPELDWFTMDTEHFAVHYHQGAERTARVVAEIAEDIYQPVTDFYDWRPDGKIHFIIKDHDDNANGAAYYYDNKVEIWAPQMSFILRGTHSWLRNVVTHEFSHMISLGASRKVTRHVPAMYVQWMNYEREKRPDVLYGFPNQIASYAVPMTTIPMWLAEGMAQYMVPNLDYDRWDTHRDMLIRTAVENDEMHSFAEMGVFGKTSIGNERTYNAGYALTRYIAHHFGTESLKKLTDYIKKPYNFTINNPLKAVTGYSGEDLYADWREGLQKYYDKRLSIIEQHFVEGDIIAPKGIGNIAPTWSPDGSQLAFCGSGKSDYLMSTALMLYDTQTKKAKKVGKKPVNSTLMWSADHSQLLYARMRYNSNHSSFYDIHTFDVEKKKETRLTTKMRAITPAWSPDGESIICVTQADGTDNLTLLHKDGSFNKQLTSFKNGQAVYTPKFTNDGQAIVFSRARRHGRDLVILDLQSGKSRDLVAGNEDARDPFVAVDGSIYFSWDKTGIANIYSIQPDGSGLTLWTNTAGGAFMPSLSVDGKLAYSLFKNDGYKIAVIEKPEPVDPAYAEYVSASELAPELQLHIEKDQLVAAREHHDIDLQPLPIKDYQINYGDVMFLPRVMVDSNKVKLGSYFYANDILDHVNLFGGVALAKNFDLDSFLMLEYKKFPPTLFAEFYWFQRNVVRDLEVIEDYPVKVPVDINFTMYEGDVGASYQLTRNIDARLAFAHQRYISNIGEFYFEPQKVNFGSPANTYFIGNHVKLDLHFDGKSRGRTSSINPFGGRNIDLSYSYELNDFFTDFSTDDETLTLVPVYTPYNYHKVELTWNEYVGMPWSRKHALNLGFQGGYIDRPVDDFFNFFAGGLVGLRGYPFYSIEGRKVLIGRAAYRFPIFSGKQKQLLHMTTDQLYLGAFFDYGNAFNGTLDFSQFKKDAGVEMRLKLFSFYGFPTAFSFQAAYALDEHLKPDEYDATITYRYGKEWRYYFTLLFDFMQ